MIVLGLVAVALSQLYYLHRGLKLVSTSVLYPLVFCIYNIIAILDGLIYFRQTDFITPLQACLITLGTVILLSGVLALSWRLSDEQHQPSVGQSTLAPGLGLVQDTEGEEEEEDLLLYSDIGAEDDVLPARYSYQTFGTHTNGGPSGEPRARTLSMAKSVAPSLRTNTSRWTEQAEIWGELEDRDFADPLLPTTNRRRSSTFQARSESTPLLSSRRVSSTPLALGPTTSTVTPDSLPAPGSRRMFRKRRRSTGFPGFTARKASRRKSYGGLQDAMRALWRLRWWRNNGNVAGPSLDAPSTVVSPAQPAYRKRRSNDAPV
jgi:hypothetical protein